LPWAPDATLATALVVCALLHHAFGMLERHGSHPTHNARQAAALLTAVKAWPGSRFAAFHLGLSVTTATALLALLLVQGGIALPLPLALCAVMFWGGLFLYEQAYVRAGQLPPLS